MATYVIGDIQGCFYSFKNLLEKINFNDQIIEIATIKHENILYAENK